MQRIELVSAPDELEAIVWDRCMLRQRRMQVRRVEVSQRLNRMVSKEHTHNIDFALKDGTTHAGQCASAE